MDVPLVCERAPDSIGFFACWFFASSANSVLFMRIALVSTVLLAGCVDWPDTDSAPSLDESAPWPILKPIDEVIEPQSTAKPGVGNQLNALNARAARLQRHARTMRREIADPGDIEALRSELAP